MFDYDKKQKSLYTLLQYIDNYRTVFNFTQGKYQSLHGK
jgi:hypothetical protein